MDVCEETMGEGRGREGKGRRRGEVLQRDLGEGYAFPGRYN